MGLGVALTTVTLRLPPTPPMLMPWAPTALAGLLICQVWPATRTCTEPAGRATPSQRTAAPAGRFTPLSVSRVPPWSEAGPPLTETSAAVGVAVAVGKPGLAVTVAVGLGTGVWLPVALGRGETVNDAVWVAVQL